MNGFLEPESPNFIFFIFFILNMYIVDITLLHGLPVDQLIKVE